MTAAVFFALIVFVHDSLTDGFKIVLSEKIPLKWFLEGIIDFGIAFVYSFVVMFIIGGKGELEINSD